MVKVLKTYLPLLLLLMCSTAVHAAERFNVTVKQTTVQLGKPVWLILRTSNTQTSLNQIDFSHLEKEFEVVKDKNAIKRTDNTQSWRIRLYPRDIGERTIPALSFNAIKSQPINITTSQPVDNKTGQSFEVKYRINTNTPWLRQQVLFQYEIKSPSPKLVLAPQQTEIANSLLIPLSTDTKPQSDHYVHQTGWAVFVKQAGEHKIKLPALHLIRDGVITHHFYPPPIQIKVKPLPAYLPGNIPVGKLAFKLIHKPALVLNDRLSELAVAFRGEGIPREWLPDLRHLFSSTHQLSTYPVESQNRQSDRGAITSTHAWHIPFKALQQGLINLPSATLHYFDPQTGKLARLDIQLPKLISLSLWLVILLALIGIAATSWLLIKIYNRLIPRWRCLKTYHATLKTLPNLQTPQDIRQVIRQLSEAEGWSHNLSLRQWQSNISGNAAKHAQHISEQLEAILYRGDSFDVDTLQEEIREVYLKRWGILRWVPSTISA